LQSAESKEETFEAAIKDAQAKIDRLAASGRVASGRIVGTDDPWQPKVSGQGAPERYDPDGGVGTGERRSFGWKLYDEKYLFQTSSAFTGKDGSGWLLSLRDYLAGRTAELDRLFDHIEKMSDEAENGIGWMLQ
jgi:hypothetical protein